MNFMQCYYYYYANIYRKGAGQVYDTTKLVYIQYIGSGPNYGLIVEIDKTEASNFKTKASFITPEAALNDPLQRWKNMNYNNIDNYRLVSDHDVGDGPYSIGLLGKNMTSATPCFLLQPDHYEYQRFVLSSKGRLICNGYELTMDENGNFGKVSTDINKKVEDLPKASLRTLTDDELKEYIMRNTKYIYFKLVNNPYIYIGRENAGLRVKLFDIENLPTNPTENDTKHGIWKLDNYNMTISNPDNSTEVLVINNDKKVTMGSLDDPRTIYYDPKNIRLYYYADNSKTDMKYVYAQLIFDSGDFILSGGQEHPEYVDGIKVTHVMHYDWMIKGNILDMDNSKAKDCVKTI